LYICICHAVTKRQLLTAIDDGARTMRELSQQLGVGTCCGKCGPDVRCALAEATQPAEPVMATPKKALPGEVAPA